MSDAYMSSRGAFGKAATVRFERLLPGPIEQVWAFITEPEHMPAWFGDGAIEPGKGGAVTLMGGHIKGVVTQWDPPHKLAYTWNVFGPGDARSLYPESYLTLTLERAQEKWVPVFRPDTRQNNKLEREDDSKKHHPALEPRGDQVLLTLDHLPVLERFEKQNAMGWHTYLDMLAAALRGEAPLPRKAHMERNAVLYGVDMNDLAR